MQVADLFVRFVGDDAEIKRQLEGLDQPANKAGQKSGSKFGQAFSQTAKKGLTVAGGAAGGVFTGAVESATAFEDQLKTIQTVAPDLNLDKTGADILQLSKDTGKATSDLTAGFYDLVSAGIPADQAIGVLRDSAKLATGALSTTGESVDLLTSAMNAYGLSADQSGRVSDIFAQAVAAGKVTASELAGSIAQVAPIAASAGVSLEEVAAGYATLTAKGVPAAQASTQMRAAISALLTPNEQLNKVQQETGKNFAAIARDKGLGVAMEELRVAFAGNGDALAKLAGVSGKDFPKALKAAQKQLGLSNTDVEKFTKLAGKDGAGKALAALSTSVGAADSGYAKALGSVEAYGFALNSTGENSGAFAKAIEDSTGSAGKAQEQYDIKASSAAESGNRIAASVAAMAIQFGGPFVQTLGPALTAINQLGPAMGGVLSSGKLLGAGIGALGGKIIGGLVGLLPAIMGPLTALGSGIGGVISAAIPIGMALLPVLLLAAVVGAVIFLINNPEIVNQALQVGGAIVGAIVDALGALLGFAADLVGKVVGFLGGIPGAFADMAISVVANLLGIPSKALSGIVSGFGNMAAQAVGAFLGGIADLPGKVADAVGNVGNFLGNLIPHFATGALKVPNDTLAMVHAGEMIIPAKPAEALRRGSGPGMAAPPGAGAGGYASGLTVNVYNPAPEPASTSTKRELQKVALFGSAAA